MTVQIEAPIQAEPASEKTVAAVLRHAALIIEERGLNKDGGYASNDGAVCAIGAINVALTGDPQGDEYNDQYTSPLYDHVMHLTGDYGVTHWNDALARTAAEVTAALRAAADEWEARR